MISENSEAYRFYEFMEQRKVGRCCINPRECPYWTWVEGQGWVCGWQGFLKGEPNCAKGVSF